MQKIQRYRDRERDKDTLFLCSYGNTVSRANGAFTRARELWHAWQSGWLFLFLPSPCLPIPLSHATTVVSFSCDCGCDCACLLTLEMAGDNNNLIIHGASQSGQAQPSPVQPGQPRTARVQDDGAGRTRGETSSRFNGLAQIARWRFWWNFKCSLWPNEARVAGNLTRLGLACLGLGLVTLWSVVSKTASKCKLIN